MIYKKTHFRSQASMDKDSFTVKDDEAVAMAGEKVNFPLLLLQQINRINILMSVNAPNFPDSIEALECILYPYLDFKYNEDLKIVKDIIKKQLSIKASASGTISSQINNDAKNYLAVKKYKLLMNVAERAGHLPTRSIEIDIG